MMGIHRGNVIRPSRGNVGKRKIAVRVGIHRCALRTRKRDRHVCHAVIVKTRYAAADCVVGELYNEGGILVRIEVSEAFIMRSE